VCENARLDLENYYLTGIKGDVAEFDQKIQSQEALIRSANEGSEAAGTHSLQAMEASAGTKRAQISNAHKAGERLTKLLHTFLGRSELVFNSGDEGYRILRNGRAAKRLSEGERTAIAFIYFIVQLEDQDFDLANGVVVIDDPVSSLDASSVYQAFSFLKSAVKDAKQVFLMTHSFSFLRLLLNWLQNVPNSEGRKAYFMLVCLIDATSRTSSLTKLDKALIEHPTEYHFLFKILAQFENDGTIAGCYHIPNVVRKVLETFLDFYAPAPKSLHAKLNSVAFDDTKRTAIYKFSNDLSHRTGQGFEPGLVQESQKNAAYLLEMIKSLAPEHYEGMMASIA
jgi:wobble nucleotide-excising tRNase